MEWKTGQLRATLNGHRWDIFDLAFSPDGKLLASASSEPQAGGNVGVVKIWNVATGVEVATLTGHRGDVQCVVFAHDGKDLGTASLDTRIVR